LRIASSNGRRCANATFSPVARKSPEPIFATSSGAHLYGFASPDSISHTSRCKSKSMSYLDVPQPMAPY
jgi:hypothetical protein